MALLYSIHNLINVTNDNFCVNPIFKQRQLRKRRGNTLINSFFIYSSVETDELIREQTTCQSP